MAIKSVDVLIIGAGVTGLGSAWRINELTKNCTIQKNVSWLLVEKSGNIGGAAASYKDDKGFTWDTGSHVIYSRYKYFDKIISLVTENNLYKIDRMGWVWLKNVFIPYPLQHNLQKLPSDFLMNCLDDMLACTPNVEENCNDFEGYVTKKFGKTLADNFFIPYAYKMFGYPAEDISCDWAFHSSGSKYKNVPGPDLSIIIRNIIMNKDSPGWKSGDKFPYPKIGGAGVMWERFEEFLPVENIEKNQSLVAIDLINKIAEFSSGLIVKYENMISTAPLPELLRMCGIEDDGSLKFAGAHVVGIGFKGKLPEVFSDKLWVFNPNLDDPYFRLSFPSNYSSNNVPQNGAHWSALCEISTSPKKPIDENKIVDYVESSLRKSFPLQDYETVSTWHGSTKYAYALPSHNRDEILEKYDEWLMERSIYSRGRFGNWKYECGNQDSSFMQGVEVVDKILFGTEELTHKRPELIGENLIDRVI